MVFFSKKNVFWLQNSDFPAKKFHLSENQTAECSWSGTTDLFDSTHKQAVATVRMSSETAPVSEPVYDYSDDKHVPAAACAESWTPTL